MEKRSDAQIYELAYKKVDYELWDNSLYTPLQCGADRSHEDVCELKDNTGDNISSENFYYSELTGTYWIWKNAPKTKYIGQCQYRRRLKFDEDYNFDEIFENHKIIVNKPLFLGNNILNQMKSVHPQIDTAILENVVYQTQPYYALAYNNIMKKARTLFFSSSYVMKHEDFERYCEFAFPIIDEYQNRFGFDDKDILYNYTKNKMRNNINLLVKPIEYHMLIGGFLQERLFTIWVLSNFRQNEIYYKDFFFTEGNLGLKTMHINK